MSFADFWPPCRRQLIECHAQLGREVEAREKLEEDMKQRFMRGALMCACLRVPGAHARSASCVHACVLLGLMRGVHVYMPVCSWGLFYECFCVRRGWEGNACVCLGGGGLCACPCLLTRFEPAHPTTPCVHAPAGVCALNIEVSAGFGVLGFYFHVCLLVAHCSPSQPCSLAWCCMQAMSIMKRGMPPGGVSPVPVQVTLSSPQQHTMPSPGVPHAHFKGE